IGDKIAKLVPPPVLGVSKSIDESLTNAAFSELYKNDKEVRHIVDTAKSLEGLVRQTSIHPAGVVIAPAPVVDFIPLMQRYKNGVAGPVTTQWEMYGVERSRLLKIDFLALRNLAIIDLCVENVRGTQDIDIDIDAI